MPFDMPHATALLKESESYLSHALTLGCNRRTIKAVIAILESAKCIPDRLDAIGDFKQTRAESLRETNRACAPLARKSARNGNRRMRRICSVFHVFIILSISR